MRLIGKNIINMEAPMRTSSVEKAKYLTLTDVKNAFTLYRINFGVQWVPHHSNPRIDAVEALEAVHNRKR